MELLNDKNWEILQGNCLKTLKELPDNCIQTCITSPPYYALRDYGTGHWEGGDPNCPHYRTSKYSANDKTGHKAMGDAGQAVGDAIYKTICPLCGAVRVDEQIGLEETPDEYIDKLVQVFHEVKRVLKDDGTLWINIGDSYATNSPNNRNFIDEDGRGGNNSNLGRRNVLSNEIKPKDLIGIPWMLAFALRKDGWYLRQDIIWEKTNPMPESVKDRCTKSHEYIFLFSKQPQYYFNADAIKEPTVTHENRPAGIVREREYDYDSKRNLNPEAYLQKRSTYKNLQYKGQTTNTMHERRAEGKKDVEYEFRNKRDVWTVGVNTYKGAHFATYPEELILPCVLAGSKPNDIVLDVFNGSGTTGLVAMKNDRKYIGLELNSEYIELTTERFENFKGIEKIVDTDTGETVKVQKSELW